MIYLNKILGDLFPGAHITNLRNSVFYASLEESEARNNSNKSIANRTDVLGRMIMRCSVRLRMIMRSKSLLHCNMGSGGGCAEVKEWAAIATNANDEDKMMGESSLCNDENESYSKVAEGDGDSEDREIKGNKNSLVRGNDEETQMVFAMAS